jgi:inner membrane protein
MMARSHVVVGLAAWVAIAPPLHLSLFDPLSVAFVVSGSLLPDIDHPKSWVGRRLRPVSTLLASVLGHRGVTHSAVAIVALVAWFVHIGYRRAWICGLVIGYLSHLMADMLTHRGLRLAWPLRGTWCLPIYKTGSPVENIVVVLILVAVVTWEIQQHGGVNWLPLLWR